MGYHTSRSVQFQDDLEDERFATSKTVSPPKPKYSIHGAKISGSSSKVFSEKAPKSLKAKVLSRVFSEDYEYKRFKKKILDPRGPILLRWNKIFLVACLVSLFVDPLFFYLPETKGEECVDITVPLEVVLTIVRSLTDVFYSLQIFVRFRTAFVAPSSRVFGRGELVIDPSKISSRYLSKGFWIDLIAALPLPQVLVWFVIPNLEGSTINTTKNVVQFSILFQHIPRLFLIFPLSAQMVKATGGITETAWAGAAYNLLLFMLASHVIGSAWYLLSIKRQEACWKAVCNLQSSSCQYRYFDCRSRSTSRSIWYQSSNITNLCRPGNGFYEFGIYGDSVNSGVTSSPFLEKYLYSFWWGLRNLCCLGQNLTTSTYIGENCFAILISVLGLVLFALLIGNMQTYLQSTTTREEECRIKRTGTEQWMRHRQLPPELRQCVRRYDQFKWAATRGVDEEALLKGLPMDLRRDIKRHLCLDLVRRVPLFDQMDEQMLNAMCERLKPALYTHGTCLVRELDHVNEMQFIIRGHLDSYTTNGGRTGFFNSCRIGPGDFCGEELLTWALDPRPTVNLPSSTRTVTAISDVEAFALDADDLKFVAAQFRRLHSKKLRHKFRFYSHQWRTWAACFIQAAWRRHKRRQRPSMELLKGMVNPPAAAEEDGEALQEVLEEAWKVDPAPGTAAAMFVAQMVASTRRGRNEMPMWTDSSVDSPLPKPTEPDFSMHEEDC